MIEIVNTELEHLVTIAENMRQADRNEVWAARAMLPMEALSKSVDNSDCANTVLYENRPAAIVGVGLSEQGKNVIWMLGTKDVDENKKSVLRLSAEYVTNLKQRYDYLCNYVDARHSNISWLQWLGFTVMESTPYGPFRMPFHYFYWNKQEMS